MADVVIPPAPEDAGKAKKSLISGHRKHHVAMQAEVQNTSTTTSNSLSSTSTSPFPQHNEHYPHGFEHEHHATGHESPWGHGVTHDISEKILRITCLISIIAWLIAMILLSIITESSPFVTFVGLSPLLLTIVVTYLLVDRYHMESGFLIVFPFIFTGIFLILGVGRLLGGMDYLSLSTVNVMLGIVFEAVLVLQHHMLHARPAQTHHKIIQNSPHATKATESNESTSQTTVSTTTSIQKLLLGTPADIEKFVASIEDKAKAINAVIGRVYSVRRGGSESLRKRIRIDASHYNEFNELKDKRASRRKEAALKLLRKIRERLSLLEQKESEVLDLNDLNRLMNLTRDHYGHDKIIDVLVKNDSDPVKVYYDGAVQFCDTAVKDLQEEIAVQAATAAIAPAKAKQQRSKLSKQNKLLIFRKLRKNERTDQLSSGKRRRIVL